MSTLRLMYQNQWNCTKNLPNWEEMGLDCSAETRMKGHVQVFSELMPDIMGGQEVNKDMLLLFKLGCLEKGLPYSIIWGNYTPIIYRADKLELLDTEFVLYPKNLDGFEGSFNDAKSKGCNLGVFRSKESGKVFIFATTHLWWMKEGSKPGSDLARVLQVKQALAMIDKYREKYSNCPVIFGGDMNSNMHSDALQYVVTDGGYTHAHDEATEFSFDGIGFNRCGKNGPGQWVDKYYLEAIDHIFLKGLEKGAVKRFDRYCPDYYLVISDHAPVFIDVEL